MTALTIPAPRRTVPAMARFLTALGNEIRKGLLFAWSERLQIAMELPFFALFILLLGPMLGAGHQIAAVYTQPPRPADRLGCRHGRLRISGCRLRGRLRLSRDVWRIRVADASADHQGGQRTEQDRARSAGWCSK